MNLEHIQSNTNRQIAMCETNCNKVIFFNCLSRLLSRSRQCGHLLSKAPEATPRVPRRHPHLSSAGLICSLTPRGKKATRSTAGSSPFSVSSTSHVSAILLPPSMLRQASTPFAAHPQQPSPTWR